MTPDQRSPRIQAILIHSCIVLAYALMPNVLLAQTSARFIESSPVPGGVALIELDSVVDTTSTHMPTVRWNNKDIAILEVDGRYTAVVGIPLSMPPGKQSLSVVDTQGISHNIAFVVDPFHYEEQHLVIKNKRKVNPAPVDMKRINKENKRLKVVKSYRANRMLATSFEWPLSGPISSPFGLKRFYNEQPRRPHGGIDIAASEGTLIRAPADGVVIETGDYFFNGNCVFIEHGLGLQTFYAHMSRIDVEPGDRISQGQILGAVGQTGRVTGPHLHWSVGLNGTWVNPLLVLSTDAPPLASQ